MLLAQELHGPIDANPLVLIHGITESRQTWRPIIDRLSHSRRVLAVDLRGHGEMYNVDDRRRKEDECSLSASSSHGSIHHPTRNLQRNDLGSLSVINVRTRFPAGVRVNEGFLL